MASARRQAVWLVAGLRAELQDAGEAQVHREVEEELVPFVAVWVEQEQFLRREE